MNAIQQLFAPLDKDFCLIFYGVTVVNLFFLVFAGLGFVTSLVLLFRGKITVFSVFYSFIMVLVWGLMYFQARLFYSMCVTSNLKAGSYFGVGAAGRADSLPVPQ
jgi:hypothetical protein